MHTTSLRKTAWWWLFGITALVLVGCFMASTSAASPVVPNKVTLLKAPQTLCSGPITFAAPVTYTAGTRPRSAALYYLNSADNFLDLVVTNYSANSVSVFLGNANGAFQPSVSYSVGVHPVSVAIADLNNDTKSDLVVSNYDSANVTVLLGNGNGTFQTGTPYSSNIGPYGVTTGDFNENNKLDVATSNVNFGTINVMLGGGDGSLQGPTSYPAGLRPQVISRGRFNADLHDDLVVPNYTASSASVFLGNGDGTFQSAVAYTMTAFPDFVTVADMDNDSHDDLVLSHYNTTNNIGVALGNGNGTFDSELTTSTGGDNPTFAAVGDFNGDGIRDLASPGYGSDNVSVLRGNGDGTFQAPLVFALASGSSPVAVLAGDFNSDGRLDMFTANENTNDISVFLNTCMLDPNTPTSGIPTPTHTPTSAPSATAANTATTAPSSTSTSTPASTSTMIATATYTSTPVPPTNTPAPTACPIQFTDVPEGSTFYTYVRCLACRGIVGGYTTAPPCTTGVPCFLPANNVTRGQMAKFISNAANYTDTILPSQQTFTDVPPSSTFWLYIERVYLHNVVSGYTTNPPCTTGTPCFLPGNNVTRGQAAKFVSISAGYTDPIPATQQTFTDVPPMSTFWEVIERVYLHSVISGYTTTPPCTTGTPCFLPANNVTRGQTAKLISNAFFPDCPTP